VPWVAALSRCGGRQGGAAPPRSLQLENCLAAAACPDVGPKSLDEICCGRGVGSAAPRSRSFIRNAQGRYTLVDDSYNSNPTRFGQAWRAPHARRQPAVMPCWAHSGAGSGDAPLPPRGRGGGRAPGFSPAVFAVGELSPIWRAGGPPLRGGPRASGLPVVGGGGDWAGPASCVERRRGLVRRAPGGGRGAGIVS